MNIRDNQSVDLFTAHLPLLTAGYRRPGLYLKTLYVPVRALTSVHKQLVFIFYIHLQCCRRVKIVGGFSFVPYSSFTYVSPDRVMFEPYEDELIDNEHGGLCLDLGLNQDRGR